MLYFACPDHLLAVDMKTREQKTLSLSSLGAGRLTAMTLTGDKDKSIFAGFSDNTIARLDVDSFSMQLHRAKIGRVRTLFPDPEGLLWISTDHTGIWSFDSETDRFRHYEHSSNVMSYYVDTLAQVRPVGDKVWVKMN